jgi:hypothetical protein
MIYDAQSLILGHLNPVRATYIPKDIQVQAIEVSRENIGKLALEFDAEMFYNESGLPYFNFKAKRFNEEAPNGQETPRNLQVRLGVFIVALWGELHIYQSVDFANTFATEMDISGAHASVSYHTTARDEVHELYKALPSASPNNPNEFAIGIEN